MHSWFIIAIKVSIIINSKNAFIDNYSRDSLLLKVPKLLTIIYKTGAKLVGREMIIKAGKET